MMRGDPDRRQRAHVALVLHRNAQRTRPHLGGDRRRMRLVEDQRQVLPLLGRLALDVDEMREMRHRLEQDDEVGRQRQRQLRLLARADLHRVDGELLHLLDEVLLGQIDAGAPEDLPEVFPHRQQMRIVRRDPAHARAHGEGDLDHLVERRLVGARAQRAVVGLLVHRLGAAGLASSTPPQPGHSTFQFSSNRPSREACRKPLMVFSSSSPRSAANFSDVDAATARGPRRRGRASRWRRRRRDRPNCGACRTAPAVSVMDQEPMPNSRSCQGAGQMEFRTSL